MELTVVKIFCLVSISSHTATVSTLSGLGILKGANMIITCQFCGNKLYKKGTKAKFCNSSCSSKGNKNNGFPVKHGLTGTSIYTTWKGIKRRCYNKNEKNYENYGGRGIVMCDRWKNSPELFYKDMGDKPSKEYSIDRIENNGNYEPGNCRWATATQQVNNQRPKKKDVTGHRYTYKNETHNLTNWARINGIKAATLRRRIRKGMTIKQAIETPLRVWPSKQNGQ